MKKFLFLLNMMLATLIIKGQQNTPFSFLDTSKLSRKEDFISKACLLDPNCSPEDCNAQEHAYEAALRKWNDKHSFRSGIVLTDTIVLPYDTVPCLMWVSDTTTNSSIYNHSVYQIRGYAIIVRSISEHCMGYLDADKKPLKLFVGLCYPL